MKLTEEKLKQLIMEEISYLSEEENTNKMIDEAQKLVETEAKLVFNKIKQAAIKSKLEVSMLKGLFIQFLEGME